jgi:hypothetical protein
MDLVLNVMLGNSLTPQAAAPSGKVAGAGFASLLPFIESMDGAVAEQSVNAKPQPGGKNPKPATDAKQHLDPNLLATLNPQIVAPQNLPPVPPAPVPTVTGASPSHAGEGSAQDLTAEVKNIAQLLKPAPAPVPGVAKEAPDHTPLSRKTDAQDGVPQLQVLAKDQAQPQEIAATTVPPTLPAEAHPVVTQSVAAQGPPSPSPKSVEPKPAEPKSAKADDHSHNMASLKKATVAAADPAQVVESFTVSAVKVALKSTLPAQSKISATMAASKLPAANVSPAAQSGADVHFTQAHAVQSHESQPSHEQPKKQEDNAPVPVQGAGDSQPAGQVNAVTRVVSPDLNSEPPKPAITAASTAPAPVKQEASNSEPPVLPNSAVALQSARLLHNLGQSELRVGMKMGDLGNVEIRTQLRHDQLHAEISVERGDLSHTLSAELPALQQRLREHDLPAASIVVNHQAPAGSGGFERGPQQQQQTTTPMSYAFGIDPVTSTSSPEEIRIVDSALDVHI